MFNGYRISVVQEEESWRWKVVMVSQSYSYGSNMNILNTVKLYP